LVSPNGAPIAICAGFISMLANYIGNYDACAIAFDLGGETFRHKKYPLYKANRNEKPEGFEEDLEVLRVLLELMCIPTFTQEGYEADDIIATLSRKSTEQNYEVHILSVDKDFYQLVNSARGVFVLSPMDNILVNESVVYTRFSVYPRQIVDYKAIAGDRSDNYKGIDGVGPKGAAELLGRFGNLEQIYFQLDEIKNKKSLHKKMLEGESSCCLSRFLAHMNDQVPIDDFDINLCRLSRICMGEVYPLAKELNLMTSVNKFAEASSTKVIF
jgi:DNA polymerase-1